MKRVLIVNPFGLGDCLFLSPVLRALKEEGGVEKTVLLLGSRTSELFQSHPFVDEVIAIDRDELRAQSGWKTFQFLRKLVGRLKREKFDAFIDVSLSREYAFAAKFFLRIPKRVGFDYHSRGIFLTDRIALPQGYHSKHVVEYYRDLVLPLGLEAGTRELEIFLQDEEIQRAGELLSQAGIERGEPFTVLAPGGGESWGRDARFKRWPAKYFSDLVRTLTLLSPSQRERGGGEGVKIVILGSSGERELGEALAGSLSGFHIVNWTGQRTLRESLSVLACSSLVLANDGGICHAARALNRPLAAVFGPVDPLVYGPFPASDNAVVIRRQDLTCQPCYRSFRYNSSCRTIECLNGLKPEQVAQIIQERKLVPCSKA